MEMKELLEQMRKAGINLSYDPSISCIRRRLNYDEVPEFLEKGNVKYFIEKMGYTIKDYENYLGVKKIILCGVKTVQGTPCKFRIANHMGFKDYMEFKKEGSNGRRCPHHNGRMPSQVVYR